MPFNFNDIFPFDTEEILPEDIKYGPMNYNTRPCKLCGALIIKSKLYIHVEFHNELQQAINSRYPYPSVPTPTEGFDF